jgi:hypothetical protein
VSGAGVRARAFTKAVAWDFDNDGPPRPLPSPTSGEAELLYHNQGGGSFREVAGELGLASDPQLPCWFFDYDNDGWLDLFVAASSTRWRRRRDSGLPEAGERRNSTGTRRPLLDVTQEAGFAQCATGANFGDLDGDGWLDIHLGTERRPI